VTSYPQGICACAGSANTLALAAQTIALDSCKRCRCGLVVSAALCMDSILVHGSPQDKQKAKFTKLCRPEIPASGLS
jgi:hypothetical protein